MSEKDIVNLLKNKLDNKGIPFKEEVWIKNSVADLIVNNKIAIEAKLHDINKAFYQLGAYKRKYKNCFLYMPFSSKKIVEKNRDLLESMELKWFFIKDNGQFSFGKPHWRKTLFG